MVNSNRKRPARRLARFRGRLRPEYLLRNRKRQTESHQQRPLPAKFRRPGQRLPTRDVVGQIGANTASPLTLGHYRGHRCCRSQLYPLEPIRHRHRIGREPDGLHRSPCRPALSERGRPCGPGALRAIRSKGPVITAAARAWRGRQAWIPCRAATRSMAPTAPRGGSLTLGSREGPTRSAKSSLLLLPFRDSLPGQMFRRHRAWCTLCYDDWRASGQIALPAALLGKRGVVTLHCPSPNRSIAFAATVRAC